MTTSKDPRLSTRKHHRLDTRLIRLVVFALLFTLSPALANAAQASGTTPAAQAESSAACGATVEDNLAAAQKALQSNDKAARAALACLIAATATLNEQVRNLDRGRSAAGKLAAPITSLQLNHGP